MYSVMRDMYGIKKQENLLEHLKTNTTLKSLCYLAFIAVTGYILFYPLSANPLLYPD